MSVSRLFAFIGIFLLECAGWAALGTTTVGVHDGRSQGGRERLSARPGEGSLGRGGKPRRRVQYTNRSK